MIYLLLGICSSAAVSLCIRASESHIRNNITMLAFNYLACTILGFGYGIAGGMPGWAFHPVLLGAVNGAFYLSGFLMLQYSIRRNGVVLSSTFMKLGGVLVPILLALVIFHEHITVSELLGIALAIAAIFIINHDDEPDIYSSSPAIGSLPTLLLLLFSCGLGDAMSKVFEETGRADMKNLFLAITFLSALILSSTCARIRGQHIAREDVIFGLIIGIPNYFSARFLLLSLTQIPAVIAYPTYSVATVVVITIFSLAVFREKIKRNQWIAIGIILLSLILLNI